MIYIWCQMRLINQEELEPSVCHVPERDGPHFFIDNKKI